MRFFRVSFFVLVFALCVGAALPAAASPAPASDGEGHVISLDVIAAPRDGAPLQGLTAQDFTLLDNGKPQPIQSFMPNQNDLAQTKVILLLDAINTPYIRLGTARQEVENFLRSNKGHLAYPTALALAADDSTKVGSTYSTDGNLLAQNLKEIETGLRTVSRSQGFYGAEDRVRISIHSLEEVLQHTGQMPGRKLLVWISPGWAYFAGSIMEQKPQESLFREIALLSNMLRETRTTLYAVDPSGSGEAGLLRTSFYAEFLKPVKRPRDVSIGDISLGVLAIHSGGQVLNSSNNVAGLIQRAVSDAEPFYTLTYVPVSSGEPDEYHSIEVKVNRPGLAVRTAAGYYAGR